MKSNNVLEKPHFISTAKSSISGITGFILTVVPFLISSDKISFTSKIIAVLTMWLIIIIINLIIYNFRLKKYCNIIEKKYNEIVKRHNALSIEFTIKVKQNSNLEKIIEEEDIIIKNIIEIINSGITNISIKETEYLERLLSITYANIEHINNIKGDR